MIGLKMYKAKRRVQSMSRKDTEGDLVLNQDGVSMYAIGKAMPSIRVGAKPTNYSNGTVNATFGFDPTLPQLKQELRPVLIKPKKEYRSVI